MIALRLILSNNVRLGVLATSLAGGAIDGFKAARLF